MSTIERALAKKSRRDDIGKSQKLKSNFDLSKSNAEVDLEIDTVRMFEAGMLVPGQSGRSTIAEEYRQIKRPLLRNIKGPTEYAGRDSNLIMVTSALPGEGKTFTSVNLAMSIAMELDNTCLLVDADVARPSVMKTLGIQDRDYKGLVDYLVDKSIDLSDVLLRTNVPKLTMLPSGRTDVHATELLSSENMHRLVQELSERYHDRVIIFDSPPLLATSESRVLASLMGQVVLVVEALKTQQSAIKQALEFLDKSKYIGLVLNKGRSKSGHGYGYGYGYGYGHDADSDKNDSV